jgi:hypothetical protein
MIHDANVQRAKGRPCMNFSRGVFTGVRAWVQVERGGLGRSPLTVSTWLPLMLVVGWMVVVRMRSSDTPAAPTRMTWLPAMDESARSKLKERDPFTPTAPARASWLLKKAEFATRTVALRRP